MRVIGSWLEKTRLEAEVLLGSEVTFPGEI